MEKKDEKTKETAKETVPTYGLLAINHAYNEGKITFKEWLKYSREWAEQIAKQYGRVLKFSRIDIPLS